MLHLSERLIHSVNRALLPVQTVLHAGISKACDVTMDDRSYRALRGTIGTACVESAKGDDKR